MENDVDLQGLENWKSKQTSLKEWLKELFRRLAKTDREIAITSTTNEKLLSKQKVEIMQDSRANIVDCLRDNRY